MLIRRPHVREAHALPLRELASDIGGLNPFDDLVGGLACHPQAASQLVVWQNGPRRSWVETDGRADAGVVDELPERGGRICRRAPAPHHHADEPVVTVVGHLIAGDRQHFDRCPAGNGCRRRTSGQRHLGIARHHVLTEQRILGALSPGGGRREADEYGQCYQQELFHTDSLLLGRKERLYRPPGSTLRPFAAFTASLNRQRATDVGALGRNPRAAHGSITFAPIPCYLCPTPADLIINR